MLPKLKFAETLDTLLSYVLIAAVVCALIVFGMRTERQLLIVDCQKSSIITIEGEQFACHPK